MVNTIITTRTEYIETALARVLDALSERDREACLRGLADLLDTPAGTRSSRRTRL